MPTRSAMSRVFCSATIRFPDLLRHFFSAAGFAQSIVSVCCCCITADRFSEFLHHCCILPHRLQSVLSFVVFTLRRGCGWPVALHTSYSKVGGARRAQGSGRFWLASGYRLRAFGRVQRSGGVECWRLPVLSFVNSCVTCSGMCMYIICVYSIMAMGILVE